MKCPYCGKEIPNGENICPNCKAEIPQIKNKEKK